jgi:hypothetical protein
MIANPLYSIKQRRIELTSAELKAPGKELAYIIKSNESFPDHEDSSEQEVCQHCGGGGEITQGDLSTDEANSRKH